MTLHLIGVGLGDEKDITCKGLEIVQNAHFVYLEHYTAILGVDVHELEEFYGRPIRIAERDIVESHAEEKLLLPAKESDIVLLVVGDPFGATTHTDLVLRAAELGVSVNIVHNTSILNAIGVVGLELYKFGKTTSIPYWVRGFEPENAYDVIKENQSIGAHTLCLLDIKVNEPSREELLKGSKPGKAQPRFMSVGEGIELLQQMEKKRKENVITNDMLAIGVARIGHDTQQIVAGPLSRIKEEGFGTPLHSLIIPGPLQVVEEEALKRWERE